MKIFINQRDGTIVSTRTVCVLLDNVCCERTRVENEIQRQHCAQLVRADGRIDEARNGAVQAIWCTQRTAEYCVATVCAASACAKLLATHNENTTQIETTHSAR